MIQVCSQCGTRWNVRDKQRVWCPRCNGTLLAPATTTPAAPAARTDGAWSAGPRTAPRLPPGYRWIALRPGPPPPPRRRRRPLGPTPRYTAIPRWGLRDSVGAEGAGPGRAARPAPSADRVRTTFFVAAIALGTAALVHVVRYLLLVINRNTLLNWLVADAAALLSVLASLAAVAAVMTCAAVLTRWMIARRAAAFEHRGTPESRSRRALWVGTLLPPSFAMVLAISVAVVLATSDRPTSWALMAGCVALCCLPLLATVWALVYVIELARTEDHYTRLRPVIWSWWLLWLLSSMTSVFATVTSGAQDSQGIANNTAAMIVAYLLALASVLVTAKLFEGFERKPVERPAHRWVVVEDDGKDPAGSTAAVELAGEEPAA
ncbi:DUF4328 domain-containing protein [Mycobacterium cookii]|uniref:Membrane protein n=1 Tax=Mycobacterium cookii TaxID=1775 RepID=A0A7I7L0F7_9MYCO|nr:DUF4328 domain-containing protein [Mycobacterium cookii]MCV7331751.1 DUF4328 domain-containing protein [Mycobacterium cookii]BBX47052.1 membrane protein [Mycobacterium cookii]